jgi:hypothetical protein
MTLEMISWPGGADDPRLWRPGVFSFENLATQRKDKCEQTKKIVQSESARRYGRHGDAPSRNIGLGLCKLPIQACFKWGWLWWLLPYSMLND